METKEVITTPKRNIPKRITIWAGVVTAILMIPLITNAPWTGSDFIFAGIILLMCATVYELSTKNMSNVKHRASVAAGVILFIFLVMGWAASGP